MTDGCAGPGFSDTIDLTVVSQEAWGTLNHTRESVPTFAMSEGWRTWFRLPSGWSGWLEAGNRMGYQAFQYTS